MVKTNIIKTKKKIRKINVFFLIFFNKIRGPFWDTSMKIYFLANKEKIYEYMNAFVKENFFTTIKNFFLQL